ncbi:hypothetical protein PAMP_022977 [Pampus punctatissimus]
MREILQTNSSKRSEQRWRASGVMRKQLCSMLMGTFRSPEVAAEGALFAFTLLSSEKSFHYVNSSHLLGKDVCNGYRQLRTFMQGEFEMETGGELPSGHEGFPRPRIAGEEREKYLTKREMRKTLKDMMGVKRAEIDTRKEKQSSTRALLINQTKNRHQERRRRRGEEEENDGWRPTSEVENEVSSSRASTVTVLT